MIKLLKNYMIFVYFQIDIVMKKKIIFSWKEKKFNDSERVGSMYCFKRCDVNQN